MIALLALSNLALAFQATPSVSLTSYEEAVRCAGVTQAASELEGGESRQGRALYDAALYWSLAAMQAGGASGRSPQVAETDQTRARIAAVRQFNTDARAARVALQACQRRTPNLG